MTNDEYHADCEYVTGSQLCTFAKSHYDFYSQYVVGEMERKSTTLTEEGSLLHSVIVERKSLAELLHVYPESAMKSNGHLMNGTEELYRKTFPDRIYRKQQRYDELDNIVRRVLRHPLAIADAIDSNVQREAIQKANVFGVDCKCRPDLLRTTEREIVDYKFMERIYPDNIQRSASSFRYWLKVPHYTRIVAANLDCDPRDIRFVFRCVETSAPFRIFDREYDAISLDQAYSEHETLLREFAACVKSGDWSDNWPDTITMKPWDGRGEELVTFSEGG